MMKLLFWDRCVRPNNEALISLKIYIAQNCFYRRMLKKNLTFLFIFYFWKPTLPANRSIGAKCSCSLPNSFTCVTHDLGSLTDGSQLNLYDSLHNREYSLGVRRLEIKKNKASVRRARDAVPRTPMWVFSFQLAGLKGKPCHDTSRAYQISAHAGSREEVMWDSASRRPALLPPPPRHWPAWREGDQAWGPNKEGGQQACYESWKGSVQWWLVHTTLSVAICPSSEREGGRIFLDKHSYYSK